MNKKMGRPKVDNPIIINFSVKLDEETNKILTEYSKKTGITRSKAVREFIKRGLGLKSE